MDVTSTLDAPYDAARVFAAVDDLARYPGWLDLVSRAEPAPAAAGETQPAWIIDLRARVGPFARSKRLRMVRTEHTASTRVVFERRETDGKRHSPWVLTATVEARGKKQSSLTMHLHYGGNLLDAVIERLLFREIETAKPRLLALLADR